MINTQLLLFCSQKYSHLFYNKLSDDNWVNNYSTTPVFDYGFQILDEAASFNSLLLFTFLQVSLEVLYRALVPALQRLRCPRFPFHHRRDHR